MAAPLLVSFNAASTGSWCIRGILAVCGETLPEASHLDVVEGVSAEPGAVWSLRGSTGNARYSSRSELDALARRHEGLGRPQADCAALIPIRKNAAWWNLAQDERRAILEESSRHIAIGLDYLPAVSRRLHHSRELGEPFDFLTWFEYAADHRAAFDEMLARLRATEEWQFVEREVEVRLERTA